MRTLRTRLTAWYIVIITASLTLFAGLLCVWLARTLYNIETGHCISRDTLQAVALVYRALRELEDDARGGIIELAELEQR